MSLRMIATWPARRWLTAAVVTVVTAVVIAIPTDMLPNPWFTRAMDVTWWSYPVLAVTAILSGLLAATYVSDPAITPVPESPRATRLGGIGVVGTFLAVGCPMCNKLVVLAIGVSGSMAWFAPVQPYLALVSLGLLVVALRVRLRGLTSCAVEPVTPGLSSQVP